METTYIRFYKTFDKRFKNSNPLILCSNTLSARGMKWLVTVLAIIVLPLVSSAGTFQIQGAFNGCEWGKYYPILGYDLLLKCETYKYSYDYMPEVRTDGREVITIGNEKIQASLVDGTIIETNISDEFEGCDYDKRYELDNGLIFVCNTYSYSYSYRPDVKIIIPSGATPIVYIDDEKYDGTLYKR